MRRFIPYLACLAFALGLAWLLKINPQKEYGWFMGWVQGTLLVPNWLISLFDKQWLYKAPIHTTAYNVFWWLCAVTSTLGWANGLLGVLIGMLSPKR